MRKKNLDNLISSCCELMKSDDFDDFKEKEALMKHHGSLGYCTIDR